MKRIMLAAMLGLFAARAPAAAETPLFASDDPIRLTISGPVSAIARTRSFEAKPGTLGVAGSESLPVMLSARGLTRRSADICQFPPLRVTFSGTPPPQSLFAGQKSLKLVTHCRGAESFQQHVLLEYAAYRMLNALTPASFRARLATIDYVDEKGRTTSRYGFFIEDLRDVASRNGMQEAKLPELIPVSSLRHRESALYALFQHMIANHDWSMRAGPAGDECCHNSKLIAPARGVAAGVVPVPYDFDFSGLVNAPYSTPPDALKISSVRQRAYRGYCAHNGEALAAAVQIQAAKPKLLAVLAATPGLEQRTIERASAFLEPFFADIASHESVQKKVLRDCV